MTALDDDAPKAGAGDRASLATVAREWTRIGITGFGGPPAHIALLRQLIVGRMGWMDAREFEDANAACGLLPGPASTQLAIFCACRVAGLAGAVVGGLGFIVPAVVLILALSVVFLGPRRRSGSAARAPARALRSPRPPSTPREGCSAQATSARENPDRAARWLAYLAAGTAAAALIGAYLVLALLACGLIELLLQRRALPGLGTSRGSLGALVPGSITTGGIGALAWTAFKVGALSFGGGFVIIPLMQPTPSTPTTG